MFLHVPGEETLIQFHAYHDDSLRDNVHITILTCILYIDNEKFGECNKKWHTHYTLGKQFRL